MAFIMPAIPPEQQNLFGATGPTTPNPLSMMPPQTGGSSGAGGGTGGQPGTQATPTQFAPNAAKLSDYLKANADQTSAMGGRIAGDLTSQYNQTRGAVEQAGQDFSRQVGSSYTPYSPETINKAASDPTGFAANPENVKAFQSQWNDQYTGPANFESTAPYTDVQGQVGKAVENANLVNSPSGLSTYLSNKAKGTYTPGMGTLDTAIMQGNTEANKQVTEAAKPFAGLNQYLADTTAQANAQVTPAQQAAQRASGAAKMAFTGPGGVVPGLKEEVGGKVTSAQQQATDYNTKIADIQQRLNNGQPLTPEENALVDPSGTLSTLNPYGQSTGVFQNIQAEGLPGIAPSFFSKYYSGESPLTPPTAANVMTPDQIAKAKAVNTLTGSDQGVTTEAGKAFQVPMSVGTFNNQSALQGLTDTLTSYLNPIPTGEVTTPGGQGGKLFGGVAGSAFGPAGSLAGSTLGSFLDQGSSHPGSTSILNQLTPEQQQSWLTDMQALNAYLGKPSPYQGPGITPLAPPQPPGLGPGGGPPYLAPPTVMPPPSGGGGFHTF